jgi:hypothetical protein
MNFSFNICCITCTFWKRAPKLLRHVKLNIHSQVANKWAPQRGKLWREIKSEDTSQKMVQHADTSRDGSHNQQPRERERARRRQTAALLVSSPVYHLAEQQPLTRIRIKSWALCWPHRCQQFISSRSGHGAHTQLAQSQHQSHTSRPPIACRWPRTRTRRTPKRAH